MNISIRPALACAAGVLLLAGAAQAQGVMTPGAMPPPPSFRDSAKASESKPQKRRAKRSTEVEGTTAGETEAVAPRRKLRASTAAPASSSSGYSGRVDDRSQRAPASGLQFEDDPRAVTPSMNNGRPGVGMRF